MSYVYATRIFHYNYVLLINNDSDNNNYCFMVKRISVYVINNCVFRHQQLCVSSTALCGSLARA